MAPEHEVDDVEESDELEEQDAELDDAPDDQVSDDGGPGEDDSDVAGDEVVDGEADDAYVAAAPGVFARLQWTPVLLLQAAHAKQAVATALAVAGVALLTQRPAREVGVILLTVLVGQTILGWHNDIVDRARDAAHGTPGKPVADGRLEVETVWYAIVVAALVLVPLSIMTGITAGGIFLVSICVGLIGNVALRTGFFSWVTWAVSYGMLPAYLSYGGWGGQAVGDPPTTSITVLAGLLGVGIHFMRAVWGLVADHEDEWTYLPLKLGLRLGATRLLALATFYSLVIVVLLAVFGARDGLTK